MSLRVTAWLYGMLLRLLPRRVRSEYGALMREDYSELVAARGDVWRTWLRCTADLLARLPAEWRGSTPRRGERPVERMLTMWLELGQAARALAKRPGFTVVTALTLALGIGANVAIFAVVNAVLVRPLPYPDPDGIVVLRHHAPGLDFEDLENSPATIDLYRTQARSLSAVAGIRTGQRNLTGGREPARIRVVEATPSLFDVLRVGVELGRPLLPADAVDGAAPVAMLTHAGWREHCGGARDIVGRTVQLNGRTTEVVGVLPRSYRYPDTETAMLLPLVLPPVPAFGDFGTIGLARLADGVDIEQAGEEVQSLQARLVEDYEVDAPFLQNAQWSASLQTLRDRTVGDAAAMLWIVFGTVSFLLLVACASVANLFLVRAESRQREMGIRLALGATRTRVAASFIYESVLLGLAGGAWGLALGTVAVRLLVAAGTAQVPRLDEVSIDGAVLGFAAIVSIVAGLLFGALPLLRPRAFAAAAIGSESRGATAGRERQHVRQALIVAQLALAIVLLTGSGLMLRSFQRLRAVDVGVRPEGVLTVGLSLGDAVAKPQAARTYQQIVDEVAALAGVSAVGVTNALPLAPEALNGSSYVIESRPRAEDALPPIAMFGIVSDGFLQATGTPIVAGRGIERADHEHGRNVVVINEEFARTAFAGDDDVIGERIRFGGDTTWLEVVGVARDVRVMGAREPVRPLAYLPMTTSVSGARTGSMHLALRTAIPFRSRSPRSR